MRSTSLTFKQTGSRSDNWTTPAKDGHSRCGLCPEGFFEYVGVPDDVQEFQAVFTDRKPNAACAANAFKLVQNPGTDGGGYTLETEENMGLYGSALRLLTEMHDNGYRWLHVTY